MTPQHIVALTATIVTWGLNPILTKAAMRMKLVSIETYMIATWSVYIAAILAVTTYQDPSAWASLRVLRGSSALVAIVIADGALCLALPSYLYNTMLSSATSIAPVVITTWYGAPLLTTVLEGVLFGKHIGAVQWGGVLLSVIGLAMINSPPAATATQLTSESANAAAAPHEREILLASL
ncbi:hypothetical protein FOA52_009829 [Chlamydomonas sp. UWO 241]|nr:hypothetical protein FOA52_009829 [Chlamydomonas sp. UWO 241]